MFKLSLHVLSLEGSAPHAPKRFLDLICVTCTSEATWRTWHCPSLAAVPTATRLPFGDAWKRVPLVLKVNCNEGFRPKPPPSPKLHGEPPCTYGGIPDNLQTAGYKGAAARWPVSSVRPRSQTLLRVNPNTRRPGKKKEEKLAVSFQAAITSVSYMFGRINALKKLQASRRNTRFT